MQDKYRTNDLGLVSALYALGYRHLGTVRLSPKKLQFEYDKTDKLIDTVAAYYDNDLPINAQSYFLIIKIIKNKIYEELNS